MKNIEITQGNDYVGARAFTRVGDGWGNDISQTRLVIWSSDDCNQLPVIDVLGTYQASTLNSLSYAKFDLPRVETLKLKQGVRAYQFEVKGLTIDNYLTTLERGYLTVLGGGL